MTVPLPERPDLGQLRNRARELQRAVRRGIPEALALLARHPVAAAGEAFSLHAAQLLLARHHGFASWARLRRHVEVIREHTWSLPGPAPDEDPAARFVRLAVLNFNDDVPARRAQARALLAGHPQLPAGDLAAAAAAADPAAVEAFLADPGAAGRRCGPYGWSPLLYLAYSRLDPPPGRDAVLATARLLLAAGADPDDGRFFDGLPTPFTVLTGIFGGGERDQPPHPYAADLARLVLGAGADPNDGQALYNRMFSAADDHLELLFEFGLGTGPGGPWHRRLGDALADPATMLRQLLFWAVTHGQDDRIRLLGAHGVDLVSPLEPPPSWGAGGTPVQLATLTGHRDTVRLLVGLGAPEPAPDPLASFLDAALAGDAATVRATPEPVLAEVRRAHPGLVVWATALHRPVAVQLLVAAGFGVNARGRGDTLARSDWETALHIAAGNDDVELVRLLLSLGADPAIRDQRFDATPADWARHFGHQAVLEFLA
jgi:hypothetical protein